MPSGHDALHSEVEGLSWSPPQGQRTFVSIAAVSDGIWSYLDQITKGANGSRHDAKHKKKMNASEQFSFSGSFKMVFLSPITATPLSLTKPTTFLFPTFGFGDELSSPFPITKHFPTVVECAWAWLLGLF